MNGPAGDAEELLTVEDVCRWFKVGPSWVYDEVEAGRLPFVRLGRKHLRFHPSELREYLQRARGVATQHPARGPRTSSFDS